MKKTMIIPDEIHDWYVVTSKEYGMNTQSLMNFALKNFIDQQKTIVTADTLIKKLNEMQQQAIEIQKKVK